MDIFLTGISFLVSSLTFGLVFKFVSTLTIYYILCLGRLCFYALPHSHSLCQSFAIRRFLDTHFEVDGAGS